MSDAFAGLSALVDALRKEERSLNHQAARHLADTAYAMAAELRATYPVKTGSLKAGVKVEEVSDLTVKVINDDPEAVLFEVGAVARSTARGAYRGTVAPGNVFFPVRKKHRKALRAKFRQMLEEAMVQGMTRR